MHLWRGIPNQAAEQAGHPRHSGPQRLCRLSQGSIHRQGVHGDGGGSLINSTQGSQGTKGEVFVNHHRRHLGGTVGQFTDGHSFHHRQGRCAQGPRFQRLGWPGTRPVEEGRQDRESETRHVLQGLGCCRLNGQFLGTASLAWDCLHSLNLICRNTSRFGLSGRNS